MPRNAVANGRAARAGKADADSVGKQRSTAAPAEEKPLNVQSWSGVSRRRQAFRLTLALAVALLLVGLAALGALVLLHDALRTPTAADEASAVCAYLRSQDYDALAGEMNPAPASASTGPFDRAVFTAQLRALDRRDGTVRACTLRQLGDSPDGVSVVFTLTLRRAHVADPLASLVVVQRDATGTWTISRASTFYDAPE
jgi:hypothetical protein